MPWIAALSALHADAGHSGRGRISELRMRTSPSLIHAAPISMGHESGPRLLASKSIQTMGLIRAPRIMAVASAWAL